MATLKFKDKTTGQWVKVGLGNTEVPAHTHSANDITGGTFNGAIAAKNDTNYAVYKLRNAAIVSAVPSSMANGTIAFVYE